MANDFYKKCAFFIFIVTVFAFGAISAKEGIGAIEFQRVQQAAFKGDITEQFRLAQLYEIGMFTEQSRELAQEWYIKAAHNGSKAAHDILCWDYKIGCEK
uniref:Putative sel1 repeat family protein n=1 Tax=viral metagenome TaxID=1070528 RepID=A0A6M3KXI8_9ZZZZ